MTIYCFCAYLSLWVNAYAIIWDGIVYEYSLWTAVIEVNDFALTMNIGVYMHLKNVGKGIFNTICIYEYCGVYAFEKYREGIFNTICIYCILSNL